MQIIEHIFVPVDFHQHTDELANFAMAIGGKLGAKLTFLHVVAQVTGMVGFAEEFATTFTTLNRDLLRHAQAKMNALVAKGKADCPDCAGVVLSGEVADSLVDYVKDKPNSLIVMATHGAKGIEKIMLGSVAERVLKRASCPVLLFNPYRGERGYQVTASLNETLQPV
jgi:nucleotide-binding universal stress UspA family protein